MIVPVIMVVDGDQPQADRIARMARSMHLDCEMFDTAEEMLEAGPWRVSGVLVAEFRLLGMNGIDLQQRLNEMDSGLEIVFHTGFAETWLTVMAMRQGAYTVLDKPASDQALWDTLQSAMDRNQKRLAAVAQRQKLNRVIANLSARQRAVFEQMVAGTSNKQIACLLDVSVRTVEGCRHTIFEQTGTRNIAELVRLAVQSGVEPGHW